MSFKSVLHYVSSWNWASKEAPGPRSFSEKRKSNRIDLEREKVAVHLLLPDSEGSKATTVRALVKNVSLRGCSVVLEQQAESLSVKAGQTLAASMEIEDFVVPLTLEVVRVSSSDRQVALKYKPPFPRELERLEKFLEPRCLGLSVREIDPSLLQKKEKGLRWFQGVNDTNLFSWGDDATGVVTQQQLVFLEKVVEWRGDGLVLTGRIRSRSGSETGHMSWVPADLLDFQASPDAEVLAQAKVILEAMQIDKKVKTAFLKHLK